MTSLPFAEQATIVTLGEPTGRDALGNPTYTPTETPTTGAFAPEGSSELVQGQDTVIANPTFYLSAGAPVSAATDRLIVRGETFEINGPAALYSNPFTGAQPGAVLRLERVEG